MLEQHRQYRRSAGTADRRRSALRRLLRAALGEELGEVLRSRLGQAARGAAQGDHRYLREVGRVPWPLSFSSTAPGTGVGVGSVFVVRFKQTATMFSRPRSLVLASARTCCLEP